MIPNVGCSCEGRFEWDVPVALAITEGTQNGTQVEV